MMSSGQVLAVICYDITKDRIRAKVADALEADLVRVQDSVFEGWMSLVRARSLARRVSRLLGPDDSLRLYTLAPEQAARTEVFGSGSRVEADGYHLF